jgi:hypothetical protein
VKVAIDLAAFSALSLVCEARSHHLDLTHRSVWSRSCHSHRHRHPMPEFDPMASASSRPPQLMHAHHLDLDLVLICSTTELAPADHQSTHGKRHPRQTLASDARLACMRNPTRKKTHALSDLDWTVAYQFALPGEGRPPDLGRPGSDPPPRPESLFFQ